VSYLDLVDECGVLRVRDLQGGAAGVQDRDPAAGRRERAELVEAEDIAVETQCGLVVLSSDDEAQFADGRGVGGLGRRHFHGFSKIAVFVSST
jgi:hypothetical protein